METYATRHDARLAVFEYIDGFYHRRRRHSARGRIPPERFYREHHNFEIREREQLDNPRVNVPHAVSE